MLTPVYPATEGLRQLTLRQLTDQALDLLKEHGIRELLPEGLYPHQISLAEALQLLHRPPQLSLTNLEFGQHWPRQRLIMEELMAHNLSVLKVREYSKAHPATALPPHPPVGAAISGPVTFCPRQAPSGAWKKIAAIWPAPIP